MMRLLQRAFVVLGLVSCVIFGSLSGINAQVVDFVPSASVQVDIREDATPGETGETRVRIGIRGGVPNHFYTVWIRLRDPLPNDPEVNANPLTGTNSVPLAPVSQLINLLNVTAPEDLVPEVAADLPVDHCSFGFLASCVGTRNVVNGLLTGPDGNGTLDVTLDFVLSHGVYPFSRFDTTPFPELPQPPEILPDAEIKTLLDKAGGTIRVITHFADIPVFGQPLGHGLVPGDHEPAFDWMLPDLELLQ